jgi:hypothetical protein
MKNLLFIVLLTTVNLIFSQTFKTEVGDCIECGKEDPRLAIYLGSNSDRVFYYAQGSLQEGMTNYVDIYDAKTLKLITHCELPKTDKVFRVNAYWENFRFIVNEFGVNIIFKVNTDPEGEQIKSCLIDNNGKLGSVKKVESIKTDVLPKISGNKEYYCFMSIGESKKERQVSIQKATYSNDGISLTKVSDYILNMKENEHLIYYSNISNDGRINCVGYKRYKRNAPTIFTANHQGKISELFLNQSDSLVVAIPFNYSKSRIENDNESFLFVFNDESKKYGVLELNYNSDKNIHERRSLKYFNEPLASRQNRRKKGFSLSESAHYLQSVNAGQYIYKNISQNSEIQYEKASRKIQKSIYAMVYDRQNQYKGIVLVPFFFSLGYSWRDGTLSDAGRKNYGALTHKDAMYIFTNETPKNEDFDVNKDPMDDFSESTSVAKANFCAYKVEGTKPIERFYINKENQFDMINIIDNYDTHEGYTYVHVIIKDKRYLAKITVQD